jgi:hypothetical protein
MIAQTADWRRLILIQASPRLPGTYQLPILFATIPDGHALAERLCGHHIGNAAVSRALPSRKNLIASQRIREGART